ncbi:MAG: deoxyhypusine synthase family protein, partial [Candidatus Thorarchaeota archaeon]
ILKICSEKDIPIFCPAFTDSGLALQLGFHFQNLNLNHFKDMLKMVDLAWEAKHAGVCIIGGGVPKNFIMQSLQFSPNSAMYAIQVTMDRPEPGGLSGATLQEAVSWGKVNEKAKQSTVICDATIALPILLWFLKSVKTQEK